MENYKEQIPRLLKTMHNPGTLTKSTLNTVNTMHSWPQVTGITGWLVDKVIIVEHTMVVMSEIPKEEQHKRYDQFCSHHG